MTLNKEELEKIEELYCLNREKIRNYLIDLLKTHEKDDYTLEGLDKISYRFHAPQRDDIVVLSLPQMDEMLVKRVVGLPGETISIDDGVLYIDGVAHPEAFPHDTVAYDMAPVVLPPLYYFVLGDNRGNSNDSRSFGPVHRDSIVGRVWLRYWPLDKATIF